jgi:glycosyltransferase involved in cell wall biosynthesis
VQIADVANEIRPTMVVNNSMVNPRGYPAAKALDVPLVWMVHEFGDTDHGLSFAHGIDSTRDFIVQSSDLVVCCSGAVKEALLRGGRSGNVHTVYNLLRLDRVEQLAKEPLATSAFTSGRHLKLAVVGNLSQGKGQADVIDSLALLKERGVKAELSLIGAHDPGYDELLKKKAKKLGLGDQVRFVGFKSNPYPYMAAADAIIVASRNEAFGRVAAEAMALGIPVIASNKGGSLELVDDRKTGYLFEASDTESLAQAIQNFTKVSKQDLDAVRKRASAKARELLDVDRNAQRLAELLDELTANEINAKPAMVVEWMDALRVSQQMFERSQSELEQARQQALGQEKINLEQAKLLVDITNSKSFRLARKLANASHKVRPRHKSS